MAETSAPAGGDGHHAGDGHHGAQGGHHEIHMPPNSWSPIATAFGIFVTFIGLLVGLWLLALGLVLLVGSLVAWARGARREYLELP